MTLKYNYTAFKNHLTTNPRWIARGLQVLSDGIPGVELSEAEELSVNYMVRQLAFATGGGLPWTLTNQNGKDAAEFVARHALSIYRHYLKVHTEREKTP